MMRSSVLACSLLLALATVAHAETKSRTLVWFPDNNFDNKDNWEGKGIKDDEWAAVSFPASVAQFNSGESATIMLAPGGKPPKISMIDFGLGVHLDLQSGVALELGTVEGKVVDRTWREKSDQDLDFKCSDNWRGTDGKKAKEPPCWLDTAVFSADAAAMVVVPVHTYVETLEVGSFTLTSRNEDEFYNVVDPSQWAGEAPKLTARDCRNQFNADAAEPCKKYCTDSCAKSKDKSELEQAREQAEIAKQEEQFINNVADVFKDVVDLADTAAKEVLKEQHDVPAVAGEPTPVDQKVEEECGAADAQKPECQAAEELKEAAESEVTGEGFVSIRLQVFQKSRGRREANGTDAAMSGAETVAEYLGLVDGSAAVQQQFADAAFAAIVAQLADYMTFYRQAMHIVADSLSVTVEAATGEMVVTFKPQMSAEALFLRLYNLELIAEAVTPALVCIVGDAMASVPSARFLLGACPSSGTVRSDMKRFGAPAAQTVRTVLNLAAFELLAPEQDRAGAWSWASNAHLSLDNFKAETMEGDRAAFNKRFGDNLPDYFLASVASADFHYSGPKLTDRDGPLDPAQVDLLVTLVVPKAVWNFASQMFARAEMTKWTNVAASRAAINVLQRDVAAAVQQLEEQVASLEASEADTTLPPPEPQGETGKTSGFPLIAVIGGAAGLVALIAAIIVVVVVRRRPQQLAEESDKASTATRQVVAFENPMYDDPALNYDYQAQIEEDLEGLYDSPAFNGRGVCAAVENPLYKSRESLAGAEYMDAGFAGNPTWGGAVQDTEGYLDVGDYAIPETAPAAPTIKRSGPDLAELYGFDEEAHEVGYLDVGDMVNALPSFDLLEDE